MAIQGQEPGDPELVRTHLFGIPVDCVMPENLSKVLDRLSEKSSMHEGEGGQIVFLRLSNLLRARRDPSYRRVLQKAGLVLPVSREISRALALLGRPLPARYSPIETLIRILGWLETRSGGLYILGGSARDIMTVEQRLRQTFPGSRIVGRYMGDFPKGTEEKICTAIRKSNPLLLLGGPGLLGGDKWIGRRSRQLNTGLQVWSAEFFGYILGREHKVNKVSFRKGREYLQDIRRNPAKALIFLKILWFRFRVLCERVFSRRPLS